MKISALEFQERKTAYLQEQQTTFDGGMNLRDDISNIADNEYGVAFNVSCRYGDLAPIRDSVEIASNYVGLKQGIY